MAILWRCDRCAQVGPDYEGDDDLPDAWENRTLPVRGSKGARSSMTVLLCPSCDDALYEWLHEVKR